MCCTHTLEQNTPPKKEKTESTHSFIIQQLLMTVFTAWPHFLFVSRCFQLTNPLECVYFSCVSFKVCASAPFHQGCRRCKHRLTGCTELSAVPGSKPSDLPRKQLNDKPSQACRKKNHNKLYLFSQLVYEFILNHTYNWNHHFKKTKPGVRNN